MTLWVLLHLMDGVQKATCSPCMGHYSSQVEWPSGKVWKVIYGR